MIILGKERTIMKKNYRNQLNRWIIQNASLLFVLSIILIIVCTFVASKLSVQSNMEDMLPEDSPVLEQTKRFNSYFPSNETTIIVVEGEATQIHLFLEGLEKELLDQSFISSALFYFDYGNLKNNSILFRDDAFFEKIDTLFKNQDIEGLKSFLTEMKSQKTTTKKYFVSKDGSTYLVFLKPLLTKDYQASRNTFYEGVNQAIRETKIATKTQVLEVGLTGGAFIQDIEADTVAFDGLFSTFLLTLFAILLFLLFAFRRILLPLSMSIPLLGGALVSCAFAYVVYGSLNMFSVSFAILLLGLGIDFGVHILSRYLEEKETFPKKEALLNALNSTGSSIMIGALTTALSFIAFVIGKFKAFEQMGIISGVGILLLCLMMFTMVPGLILLLDRDKKSSPDNKRLSDKKSSPDKHKQPYQIKSFLQPLLERIIKKPWLIPIASLIVMIALLPNVLSTTVVGDVSKIYPKNLPSITLSKIIEQQFDYNTNTISIYVSDSETLSATTTLLEASPLIKSTSSILDFIPENQERKLNILSQLSALDPSTIFSEVTYHELDKKLVENYIGKDNAFLIEIVPEKDIYDPQNYKELKDFIYASTAMYPVGMPVIMNEIITLVKEDIILISMLCLIITLLLLLIIYRSFVDSIITLMPLLCALYTTLGTMNALRIDINIFSIAAFPLIIGIGIDGSIHLMHRLKENPTQVMCDSFSQTGQAIFITSMTTIIGFFSLANINHPGMANLGLAVSIGIGSCLFFTLFLLPSMYQWKINIQSKLRT